MCWHRLRNLRDFLIDFENSARYERTLIFCVCCCYNVLRAMSFVMKWTVTISSVLCFTVRPLLVYVANADRLGTVWCFSTPFTMDARVHFFFFFGGVRQNTVVMFDILASSSTAILICHHARLNPSKFRHRYA